MTEPLAWLAAFAEQSRLRYEPEPDERWLRVWEPFATLKTPAHYEHALHRAFDTTAISIARLVLTPGLDPTQTNAAWIAFVQDEGLTGPPAAATNDRGEPFRDTTATVGRQLTGDAGFDQVFASYSQSAATLALAVSPSLRKLTLGWRTPLHFELKQGGFVLAPVALPYDPQSLAWLTSAIATFAEKAKKRERARP